MSHEVTRQVMEILNKYFDFPGSFLPKKSEYLPQSLFFSQRWYPEYYRNSNDKKQRKMMHQDEEQSSDASIERVDEPQDINIAENLQMKEDAQSTVRHKTVKEMTETSNKTSRNRSVFLPFKKFTSYEKQLHFPFMKRFSQYSFDSHLNEKNQEKMKYSDVEQLSDDISIVDEYMDELQKINSVDNVQSFHDKINLIRDAINDYPNANLKENKKKDKHYQQMNTENIDNDISERQQLSNRKNEFIQQKDLPLQVNQEPYDERLHLKTLKMLENELRMNCSVVGHQMLDEDRRNKSIWSCNDLHVDSSVCNSEIDDDAYEIIQMPISRNANEKLHPEESTVEQQQHDSSRDSPSFELLSELPSPTSTYLNEDLLKNIEPEERSESTEKPELKERVGQQFEDSDVSKFAHIMDKICEHYDKKGISTKIAPETQCSEPSHDCTNSSYGDVRNSHPSYMPISQNKMLQLQCSCQSQTDLIDFTQSFHSHTTSITDTTDTTDTYADACEDNGKYDEQLPRTSRTSPIQEITAAMTPETMQEIRIAATAKNVQETGPITNSKTDFVEDDSVKEIKTNEKHYCDTDSESCTYPVHVYIPTRDAAGIAGTSQQCYRANGSSDISISNGALRRCISEQSFGAAEPVHILPATLLTAAAQVGTYAYITACDIYDKILTHAVRYYMILLMN